MTGVLPASAETETADTAERPVVPLALVTSLREALDAEGIGYCHWKSNDALDRAVRGDSDLDLLVRRGDADRFTAVLRGLGELFGELALHRSFETLDRAYGR